MQLYFKSHDHWHNNKDIKGEGKEVAGCKVGDLALKVLYGYKKSETDYYEELKKEYTNNRKGKGTQKRDKKSNFFHRDDRWKEVEAMAAKKRKGAEGEEEKETKTEEVKT